LKKRKHNSKKARHEKLNALDRIRSLHWTSWLLLFAILFFAALRFRLLDAPLERDEGEYAYSGQLMLQGIPPYQSAYNLKLPGTYAAYALIMGIFGESSGGIHAGLLLMNAATTLLVFALGRKLFGPIAGAFAGITYALLSADPAELGLAGHATHFVVFAAVAGILLLLYAIESDRVGLFFWSGTCLGLAFLMKQPGIVFSAFAILYLICSKWKWPIDRQYLFSRGGVLLAGIAWPFALTCLILYWAGVFSSFWFWTFSYARAYATRFPLAKGMQELQGTAAVIFHQGPAIWLICACGLVALFWNRRTRSQWLFVTGLLALSFAGVCAGLSFRPHYFILLLPAASVLAGVAVSTLTEYLRERQFSALVSFTPAIVFILACVMSLIRNGPLLFAPDPTIFCHRMYRGNPFPEAQEIAEYLAEHSSPDTRLVVFGSEPEIYFYSHLHSGTGYIYTYGLMEEQEYAAHMQQEMMQEVTRSSPEFVVFVDDNFSWLWRPGESREAFLNWIRMYINTHYVKAAEVDIAGNPVHIVENVAKIYVYRRKEQ
jgi:hypothetical protein